MMAGEKERLATLEGVAGELRDGVHTLRSKMNSRFNTQLVVIVGLWIPATGTILGLFLKN